MNKRGFRDQSFRCGLVAAGCLLAAGAGRAAPADALDACNVVWETPAKDASESMPCGGGDIGLNVWVEKGDVLFYMQRSGSLAEQNEYLKLGRVRLRLDPNPFGASNTVFRQELKLRKGFVEIRGRSAGDDAVDARLRIWVEVARPIIHAEVTADRSVHVTASYENWRLKDELIPDNNRRRSFFTMMNYPGEIRLSRDRVGYADDGVLFYHRNPAEGTVVNLLIEQQGLAAFKDRITDDLSNRTFGGVMTGDGFKTTDVADGKYQVTAFKAWKLASEKPAKKHHLRIVTHIEQTESQTDWEENLQQLAEVSESDSEEAFEQTVDWWRAFWNRSWIVINPDRAGSSDKAWRVGRNYNLFRYQLGCNSRGEYPTKFNGGNFTFDADLVGGRGKGFGPDWRDWGGGVHTAQNQRLLYWPMLKSGDMDAILPQFELYRKSLPGARVRAKAYFDHDGAMYSEYNSVPGIALGAGYGWERGPRRRGEEVPFGDPRADGARGYNEVVEMGVMANNCISYHWESQLEHAYMILEYHRFTGHDISAYMPFIENAVIFFDEHYRKRQRMRTGKDLDEQGKLVIYPSTSCESYRGATNPSDVVAGLQACLKSMLKLEGPVFRLRDRAYYQALLKTIPSFAFGEVEGERIIQPAASWKRYQNVECPQFYPLFPFNRFALFGRDSDLLDVFRSTWKHGTFPKGMIQSWHQDGIFFARMGMTEEAKAYNTKKLEDSPRRYPTFWGPGHDWVPDHNWGGSGMIGLQEMLMQTVGREIRLLPAWPKEWEVDFKLHAPYQTTVEGRVKNGKVIDLKVIPESRTEDVVIMEQR